MIVIRGVMVVKSKEWTKLNRSTTRVECWKYTGSVNGNSSPKGRTIVELLIQLLGGIYCTLFVNKTVHEWLSALD